MIYHTSTPDEIAYLLPVFAKNKRMPSIRKENSYYIYNTKSKEIFDSILRHISTIEYLIFINNFEMELAARTE